MGTTVDAQRRSHVRKTDTETRNKVRLARSWIYEKGYAPACPAIERLLEEESLVPVEVCFKTSSFLY